MDVTLSITWEQKFSNNWQIYKLCLPYLASLKTLNCVKYVRKLVFSSLCLLICRKKQIRENRTLTYFSQCCIIITSMREKNPYSEFFWSVFSRIWTTEFGEIIRISPYSVRMREITDQKSSEYGHISRSCQPWNKGLLILYYPNLILLSKYFIVQPKFSNISTTKMRYHGVNFSDMVYLIRRANNFNYFVDIFHETKLH